MAPASKLIIALALIAVEIPSAKSFHVSPTNSRITVRSSTTSNNHFPLHSTSTSTDTTNSSSKSVSIEYGEDAPYLEASYDPHAADDFYSSRKLASLTRLIQLLTQSSGFVTNAILDSKLNREDEMVDKRSQELLELVSDLGPTFIKVGQALSTRTDLLPAKYAKGLEGLQDAVPPFDGELGRAVIEQELGIRIDDVFRELSMEPVASASIGQVYKGVLNDEHGTEVAVKVQRPYVLNEVAMDLYMMRSLAPLWKKSQDVNTDLVGLVDAWGTGFVNELDYKAEAKYTQEFSKAMEERGLGSVFAPEVVEHLSSTHVLTTKWVDGERLSNSNADDVPRLCGVALNAYLTMLLDTGTLHCDPHPGNLLRTPDGRLCILDWGMVIDVPRDLQLSLLEFIADLNAENYEEVPNDLVKLQFVPEDKIEELRESGLTVAISRMLKLAGEGGGPKGAMQRMVEQNKEKYADALSEFDDLDSKEATEVRQRLFKEDWQRAMAEDAMSRGDDSDSGNYGDGKMPTSTTMDVTMKIEQMQEQNADVFAIPDYFVYMSRAFSTLEGIGLSSDSNYSILKECYPYLAKRLLSDDSPRARGALRTLLYGSSSLDKVDELLDLSKLQELSVGLESYTTSTSSVESSKGESDEGRSAALEQITEVVLSEDGNYIQELLLRETAVALDASVREALTSPLMSLLPNGNLQNTEIDVPGILRPLTLPLELVKASLELQSVDERDQRRLENVRILTNLFGNNASAPAEGPSSDNKDKKATNVKDKERNNNNSNSLNLNIINRDTTNSIGTLVQEATKRRMALARIGMRFGGSLATVQAERLRERATRSRSAKLSTTAQVRGKNKNDNNVTTTTHHVSKLAERLAMRGADRLEGFADAISSFESTLGTGGRN
jgi:predicted unusual protein kinase regulating ubiquinone biosynthesis (AarF/ABC1/UbiB family)